MSRRVELGCPGHFIAVGRCQFRRHTQVGNYRVSTVGDYYPEHSKAGRGGRETVGLDRYFETMVFKTTDKPAEDNEGCGCREIEDWTEVDFAPYNTAGEAQEGHERLVRKYQRRPNEDE